MRVFYLFSLFCLFSLRSMRACHPMQEWEKNPSIDNIFFYKDSRENNDFPTTNQPQTDTPSNNPNSASACPSDDLFFWFHVKRYLIFPGRNLRNIHPGSYRLYRSACTTIPYRDHVRHEPELRGEPDFPLLSGYDGCLQRGSLPILPAWMQRCAFF